MKACVFTLGCKVNEVESASIMSTLEAMGIEVTDRLSFADVYVLNTCAVTGEAEKKSRQLVARARKFNPDARVYVCGCATQKDETPFIGRGCAVFGATDKQKVTDEIAREFSLPCGGGLLYPKQVRTRAFVKISDGCDSFCSYCVIPYLRGRVENRRAEDIRREIENTDSLEIVLTGINISAYDDGGGGLRVLTDALVDTDKRIRFGSLECGVIDAKFLESLKNLKDFAPQFHLSLQSGSDAVLRSMNRKYTRAEFLEKCSMIYEFFPDAAITTDIIAGFPTETEEDFSLSLSIIEKAGFSRVHAFAFSPREGTAAWKMEDLPTDVKSARLHRLIEAGDSAEKKYLDKSFGKKEKVLWETCKDGFTSGYTGNYIKVYGPGRRVGMENITIGGRFADGVKMKD